MVADSRADFATAGGRAAFALACEGGTVDREEVDAEERRAELGMFKSIAHRPPMRIRDAAPQNARGRVALSTGRRQRDLQNSHDLGCFRRGRSA